MNSSIKVSFIFSYKGENHSPSSLLDLDLLMQRDGRIPPLDFYVAGQNRIDTYSYLFEVMQVADIRFEDARGLAVEYCQDNEFDITGFEKKWHEQSIVKQLNEIARLQLGIEDPGENEALMNALVQAFELGRAQKSR